MIERKWTPGPWVSDEESQGEWGTNYSIQQYDNRLIDIAEMVGTKEDAHLIAAAPELYEALDIATEILAACTFENLRLRGQYMNRKEVVAQARATLAKARGEA